jgi:tripartite-type tricarboxylate transporter receptor subunit TctC
MRACWHWLAVGALAFTCGLAQGQDRFPTRPIKIIIGFAAGGVSDVMARMLAPDLQKELGQPVIVENKPGASGIIAANIVSKSPPDGYTLYMAPNTHLINYVMTSQIPFHPVRDFTPITLLTTTPSLLVVAANSPWKTVDDYVAAAKVKPGEISYATSGIGTTVHLGGELFAHVAGIKLNHIPYKGANESVEAVVAGQVQSSISAVSSTLPHLKSGRVRALAVMADQRSSFLPDVPTFAELGYKGVVSDTWLGIIGPANLPAPVASLLNEKFMKLLGQQNIRERIKNLGAEPVGIGLAEFGQRMTSELESIARIVKNANIKPGG